MDVKQYAEELLKEAGADDAQRQAFMALVGNEKFAKKLSETALMHQDYSRQMDSLRKEKEGLESLKVRNEQWYAKELANGQAIEALKKEYEAKVAQFGEPDPGDGKLRVAGPGEGYLTQKQLDERLQAEGNQILTILEWVGQKPLEHYKEFGEALNIGEVKKLAIEKGISLDLAYNEMTKDRRLEKQNADMTKRLEDAKAEGAREALSKHHLPIDSKPREASPFFSRPDPATLPPAGPLREAKLREGFVEEFQKTMATSGGS